MWGREKEAEGMFMQALSSTTPHWLPAHNKRNSIAKSGAPHLRKRLRNAEGRRSSDPLSLWPTSQSFRLFCLFPTNHCKTHHFPRPFQLSANRKWGWAEHVVNCQCGSNESTDNVWQRQNCPQAFSPTKLRSHLTFNPLFWSFRCSYVTEIPVLECSNWKHIPSLSKMTQQKNRSNIWVKKFPEHVK